MASAARAFAGGALHRVLLNKYYVDELYDAAVVRPLHAVSEKGLFRIVDVKLIDEFLVNGTALGVSILGAVLRLFQNGLLRFYAWVFAAGVSAFILYLTLSG